MTKKKFIVTVVKERLVYFPSLVVHSSLKSLFFPFYATGVCPLAKAIFSDLAVHSINSLTFITCLKMYYSNIFSRYHFSPPTWVYW